VHRRDGVEEGSDRVVNIFIDLARSLNVLHQVNAVGFQCTMNAFENVERFDLIMDGVESSDKIKRLRFGRLFEIAQVADDKFNILQTLLGRIGTRYTDGLDGKVHPREPAIRIQFGQAVEYSSPTATDIQNVDAFSEAVGKAGHERKHMGLE